MIKMIFAMTRKGVIGNHNRLPWNIPSELKYFKKTTQNHDMLMGRKTFESLPKKLPGRKHIVLSRQENIDNADMVINTKEQVFNLFEDYKAEKDLFIIGGKSLIESFYKAVDELFVTIIKEDYEGDVKVDIELENWNKVEIENNQEFSVYLFEKEKQ